MERGKIKGSKGGEERGVAGRRMQELREDAGVEGRCSKKGSEE